MFYGKGQAKIVKTKKKCCHCQKKSRVMSIYVNVITIVGNGVETRLSGVVTLGVNSKNNLVLF